MSQLLSEGKEEISILGMPFSSILLSHTCTSIDSETRGCQIWTAPPQLSDGGSEMERGLRTGLGSADGPLLGCLPISFPNVADSFGLSWFVHWLPLPCNFYFITLPSFCLTAHFNCGLFMKSTMNMYLSLI